MTRAALAPYSYVLWAWFIAFLVRFCVRRYSPARDDDGGHA